MSLIIVAIVRKLPIEKPKDMSKESKTEIQQ